jgi:hypothetical protein
LDRVSLVVASPGHVAMAHLFFGSKQCYGLVVWSFGVQMDSASFETG